ncbi:MAG: AAA family ATPase [Candidatus Methylumidiphilus sp.]
MLEPGMDTVAGDGNNLPSWRFHVENLGCIKSGDFEVKPLTLLCGPNNTGKTWAMYALYGFLDDTRISSPLPEIEQLLDKVKEKRIYSWDFGAWLETHADELLETINRKMRQLLPEIFNAPEPIFAESRFDWVIDRETFVRSGISRALIFQMNIANRHVMDFHKPAGGSELQIILQIEEVPGLSSYLSILLLDHLMGGGNTRLRSQCFLIPAERNGLNLFYKELAYRRTALLHPLNIADLTSDDISQYAKPIADYIDWLNKIPELLKRKPSLFHGLAGQIEAIVGGNYSVDGNGDVSFTPEKSEEKLGFHLSSSTVKSLFGLWFYLEHQAKPGDTLMIDEPELNLHPANQRALARLLARLVNAGLRVVVSTHSDYIVREINNLIMLSTRFEGREALIKKFNYENEDFIDCEHVTAYLFEGGTIKLMEVGSEEGIIAVTFDQVIHSLNESSNDIFYAKRDGVE